jgi:tetratricopeptide (TPR) repeat protein
MTLRTPRPTDGRRQGLAPPYVPPPDSDYGEAFHRLVEAGAALRLEGPSEERLLCRGMAHVALGNYRDALSDAEQAIRRNPFSTEGHYLKGQALLALAAIKHGVLVVGVGSRALAAGLPPRRHLVLTAMQCFRRCLDANPDDPQALVQLAAADRLLADIAKSADDAAADLEKP